MKMLRHNIFHPMVAILYLAGITFFTGAFLTGNVEAAIAFSVIGVIASAVATFILLLRPSEFTMFEWKYDRLDDYREPVPKKVLNAAVEINNIYPGATFYVDSLYKRRVVDPFLIAEIKDVKFYVAVWDEPDFK